MSMLYGGYRLLSPQKFAMNAILLCNKDVNQDLVHTIAKFCPHVVIIRDYEVGQQGLQLDANLPVDLVLSDLSFDSSKLCEFVENNPCKPELILLANEPKDALQAFKCNALHCLLLPVEPTELIHAVYKASMQRQLKRDATIGSFLASGTPGKKICLHSNDGIDIVKHEDILYCTADGAYCNVVTLDGRHLVSKTLVDIKRQLDNDQFVRIHASHIINMSHVGRYVKSDGGSIVLDDGTVLPLSRRRRQEFLDRLLGY